MNKTNVKTKPSTTHRHDTPNNKTHIIKFRVTETEKMELQCTAKLLQSAIPPCVVFLCKSQILDFMPQICNQQKSYNDSIIQTGRFFNQFSTVF